MYSDDYRRAVEEATRHHATSKTYSGMFLRPHAAYIRDMIKRLGVRSVIDWGCGKGLQYQWRSHDDSTGVPKGMTIEQFWELPVFKYDPCVPEFCELPFGSGKFDLVICTHVLGSIPIQDMQVAKWELYKRAEKAVYIAEKLGPVGKQVFSEPTKFPRGWSRGDWLRVLSPTGRPGLEVILCTRTRARADGEDAEVIRGRVP